MAHHWFSYPVLDGENLFFVLSEWPILFKLHIPTSKLIVEYVLPFHLVAPGQSDYVSLGKSGDFIIFFPHFGYKIIEYNISKKNIEIIDLSGKVKINGNGPRYNYVYNYEDKIIAQGIMTTTLVVYDKTVSEYLFVDVARLFYNKYGEELKSDSFTEGFIERNNMYIPLAGKNQIITINLKNWQINLITLGNIDDNWNSIFVDRDKLYLSAADKLELVVFDIKRKTIKRMCLEDYASWIDGIVTKEWPFRLIGVNDTVVCLPFNANSVIKYDSVRESFDSIKISYAAEGTICAAYYKLGKYYSYVRQRDKDYIMIYDGLQLNKLPFELPESAVSELVMYHKATSAISLESECYKINTILEFI